jgi:hypothetical protein
MLATGCKVSSKRKLERSQQKVLGSKYDFPDLIIHGQTCTWWGSLNQVSQLANRLPCCPYCSGVLRQIEKAEWLKAAREYALATKDPEYLDFITWLRGKPCIPFGDNPEGAYKSARAMYEAERNERE